MTTVEIKEGQSDRCTDSRIVQCLSSPAGRVARVVGGVLLIAGGLLVVRGKPGLVLVAIGVAPLLSGVLVITLAGSVITLAGSVITLAGSVITLAGSVISLAAIWAGIGRKRRKPIPRLPAVIDANVVSGFGTSESPKIVGMPWSSKNCATRSFIRRMKSTIRPDRGAFFEPRARLLPAAAVQ